MIALVVAAITYLRSFFISRHRLGLEVAALRQQLVGRPGRERLSEEALNRFVESHPVKVLV
jgi:hypothetical protein